MAAGHAGPHALPVAVAELARGARQPARQLADRHRDRFVAGDEQQDAVRRRHAGHHQDHPDDEREDDVRHRDVRRSAAARDGRHGAAARRRADGQQSAGHDAAFELAGFELRGSDAGGDVAADGH